MTASYLMGQTFGYLSVTGRAENGANGKTRWHCRCTCGQETTVWATNLVRGLTTSCGRCSFHKENAARARIKHGHKRKGSASPEYSSYINMLARCHRKNRPDYARYGGRGITVCDRWRHGEASKSGFECFLADMGPKPSPQHELDRWPNRDGNYEPGNCRWASEEQQQNNRTNNTRWTIDGRTQTRAEWLREFGWSNTKFGNRIRSLKRILQKGE
jgi:hypothetical protein